MDPVHQLMAKAVACFEELLDLLCADPSSVAAFPSTDGAQASIALIGSVTPTDEVALTSRGDDVALEALAQSIGVQSGIAVVSFQLE
jgi:hypothetical protein